MNQVLAVPLTAEDVVGSYAGLRPLVLPASAGTGPGDATADLSRKHLLSWDGAVLTVVGGKLTTYRAMAEEAVDAVVAAPGRRRSLSHPADPAARRGSSPGAGSGGGSWTAGRPVRHGGTRRGVAGRRPGHRRAAGDRGEMRFAVRYEGARTVGDLLDRRTRIGLVPADRARAVATPSASSPEADALSAGCAARCLHRTDVDRDAAPVIEPQAAEETARPVRRRRWLPWAAAATAALLVIGAVTWWFAWSARMVSPGDGSFGIDVSAEDGTVTWSFGSLSVCLEGVDSAVVESVEVESGAASVTDFAVRPTPQAGADGITMLFGSEPDAPGRDGLRRRPDCPRTLRDEDYTELAVELRDRPAGRRRRRAAGALVGGSPVGNSPDTGRIRPLRCIDPRCLIPRRSRNSRVRRGRQPILRWGLRCSRRIATGFRCASIARCLRRNGWWNF